MGEDMGKLEELFKNGFILEEEFNSRKADIKMPKKQQVQQEQGETTKLPFLADVSKLPEVIEHVRNPKDAADLELHVRQLRQLLSAERNPPIQEVLNYNILNSLGTYLVDPLIPAPIAFEILWSLTNIVSGKSEQVKQVVDAGFLPVIIKFLDANSKDVVEQAVWGLGNIAGDGAEFRNAILEYGVLPKLVALVRNHSNVLTLMRNTYWTISNLIRGKPAPPFHFVAGLIPFLCESLIAATDSEMTVDILWSLSYASEMDTKALDLILSNGAAVNTLLEHLGSPNFGLVTPALRTVGNIVSGNDSQTEALINRRLLFYLLPLIDSQKKSIVKETCWAVSNITAGNTQQIQRVLDSGIMEKIVSTVVKNSTIEITKEALWAIQNATSGATKEQKTKMIQELKFADAINVGLTLSGSADIVKVTLEGLSNLLEIYTDYADFFNLPLGQEILTTLESLQRHADNEIYEKSLKILEKLAIEEDDTISDIYSAPTGFTF